jgi:uncharacterized protein DUF4242
MATFLVEAYAPAATHVDDIEGRARAAAMAMTNTGIAVRHVRSILVPDDETIYHLFEGPSSEVVAEVSRRASLRVTRIVEALVSTKKDV